MKGQLVKVGKLYSRVRTEINGGDSLQTAFLLVSDLLCNWQQKHTDKLS
jgi:hypothetical protein